MTDAIDHPGSEPPRHVLNEQWSIASAEQLDELFQLLAIPRFRECAPIALTAVGTTVTPDGAAWHFPVYARRLNGPVCTTGVSQSSEIRAVIAIPQRQLDQQRRDGPDPSEIRGAITILQWQLDLQRRRSTPGN